MVSKNRIVTSFKKKLTHYLLFTEPNKDINVTKQTRNGYIFTHNLLIPGSLQKPVHLMTLGVVGSADGCRSFTGAGAQISCPAKNAVVSVTDSRPDLRIEGRSDSCRRRLGRGNWKIP